MTSCKSSMSFEVSGLGIDAFNVMVFQWNRPWMYDCITKLSGSYTKSVTDHDMLQAINGAMNVYTYAYVFCTQLWYVLQQITGEYSGITFYNISIKGEIVDNCWTSNTWAKFDGVYQDEVEHFIFSVNGRQSLCAAGGGLL
jgi:hypothetical protein